MDDAGVTATRRAMLAGASTGIAGALAGCTETLWSRAENPGVEQVSLTIKAVPADDDIIAASIASRLRENFTAAGIDATFEPMAKAELYREILLEGEYDVFVVRHTGLDEYDALRGLLHSQYVSEDGWQNPFHFSDVTVDDLLETQLTAEGSDRDRVISDLLEHLTETVPYTTVAFPDHIGAVRTDAGIDRSPRTGLDYLELLSQERDDGPREGPLEVGVFGEALAGRLNPLAVDRNRIPGLLDLLYEPLVRRIDDEEIAWLADDVTWTSTGRLEATVTLREELVWHDGEPIDADDVAFTHRLLRDTSLEEAESAIPAPRYRTPQTVVETVDVVDDRTVEFAFSTVSRSTAVRALEIPPLPRHVWEPRATLVGERQTEALIDDNEDPIGSGVVALENVTTDAEVELVPFEEHPFVETTADRPSVLEGFAQFEGLRFQIAPNAGALTELLAADEIDLTGSRIPAGEIDAIVQDSGSIVLTEPTTEFYMIGFNSHQPTLGNPNVRRILARLIDREHALEELFGGFASPARTRSELFGLARTDLGGEETELTQFPGRDGEVDATRARELFRAENYQYEDGALLE